MKTITRIVATTGLMISSIFAGNAMASNSDQPYVSGTNQRIEQYREMVSASTMLNYSDVLLQRSTVAQKLKLSTNPNDQARYTEALQKYNAAERALQKGNEQQAKLLALESIRVIAKAVPTYYSQTAKLDQ